MIRSNRTQEQIERREELLNSLFKQTSINRSNITQEQTEQPDLNIIWDQGVKVYKSLTKTRQKQIEQPEEILTRLFEQVQRHERILRRTQYQEEKLNQTQQRVTNIQTMQPVQTPVQSKNPLSGILDKIDFDLEKLLKVGLVLNDLFNKPSNHGDNASEKEINNDVHISL